MNDLSRNMTEDERKERERRLAPLYQNRVPTAVEQVVIEAPEPPEWPEIERLHEDDDGLGCFRGMAWAVPVTVLVWVTLYQLWR